MREKQEKNQIVWKRRLWPGLKVTASLEEGYARTTEPVVLKYYYMIPQFGLVVKPRWARSHWGRSIAGQV